MKFKVNRAYLLEKLNIVVKAIEAYSPIASMSCIRFMVNDNEIELTSCNEIMAMRTIIKADAQSSVEIQESGGALIDGRYIVEIIRKLDCREVTLSTVAENSVIEIRSERGVFNLNGVRLQDYPDISFENVDNSISLNGADIKSVMQQVAVACDVRDIRPVLTGVHFHTDGSILYCEGTDSYRAVRKSFQLGTPVEMNIVLPKKSLQEISKVVTDDEEVQINFDERKAIFHLSGGTIIRTRLLDGGYPDLNRIFQMENPKYIFSAKADVLLKALDRSSIFKTDNVQITRFTMSEKAVQLHVKSSEIGDTSETLSDCEYIGSPLKISLNGKYVSEIVKAMQSDFIELQFFSLTSPIKVLNASDTSIIGMLVPLRTYD